MATGDAVNWPDVGTRVGTTLLTSNSATWTSSESGALISVSASLVSGWTYKVQTTVFVNSTVAGDVAFMRLREDTSAGTQDVGVDIYIATTTGSGFAGTLYTEYTAGSTGTKTWVVTGSRTSGTGTLGIVCSTSRQIFLTVDRVVS